MGEMTIAQAQPPGAIEGIQPDEGSGLEHMAGKGLFLKLMLLKAPFISFTRTNGGTSAWLRSGQRKGIDVKIACNAPAL